MRRRIATIALVLATLAPASAGAADGVEVGIEDERLMLSEPHRAPASAAEWAALGVDVVRIHARWFEIAPAQEAVKRPTFFDAGNHHDRRYDWAALDAAVAAVRGNDMRVMLTVTGPGPVWTSTSPRRGNPRYKPNPKEFGRFARAVASRYRSDVDRYLIWNEPNQTGWLQPQSDCRGRGSRRRCTPVAPHVYRELVRAAGAAIKKADRGAQVVAGELAPIGRAGNANSTPLAPLPFLRAFGCVDERYRTLRSGLCRRFRPVATDALGYHPHGVLNAPDRSNPDPNAAQIADLPRLERVIDRLTARRRIRSPGGRPLDLYLTEFSYQTRPPDRAVGITLRRQAVYQQQAAYIAWRNPRVRNLTQYQWDDELVRNKGKGSRRFAGWQGGLRFLDGRPKPALAAFTSPFVIDVAPRGSSMRLWGQVRPGAAHVVTLLRGEPGGGPLVVAGTVPTGPDGVWTLTLPLSGAGRWAGLWADAAGGLHRTGVVLVSPAAAGRIVAESP